MNIVLRAASASLDADACLTWIPRRLLSHVWRIGDHDRLKGVATTGGFTLGLADDDDTGQALQDAHHNLQLVAEGITRLVAEGVNVEIDVALFVTGTRPKTLTVPQALLAELAAMGVRLVVSAYPCSDLED